MNKILSSFNTGILMSVLVLLFLLSACRTSRKPIESTVEGSSPDYMNTVLNNILTNSFDFTWLSTRFSGSALYDGNTYPVSGALKMKKDSAIFISVTPILGQEVARLLVTNDTVKFINRMESTYYIGGTDFFVKKFNTNIDFDMLQAIFTGNDFKNASGASSKVSQSNNEIQINHYSRSFSKLNQSFIFDQQLLIRPSDYRLSKNSIFEKNSSRVLTASYSEFVSVSGQNLPHQLDITFSDNTTQAQLNIKYSRLNVNEPQNLDFSIPKRYKPMVVE